MLQRMQTIWLLLAAVFSFLTLRFPVYNGNKLVNGISEYNMLSATSSLFLIILSVAAGLIALIALFLYKNRGMQQKLCFAGLLLFIISGALYYMQIKSFAEGAFSLWTVFYFLIPVCFILAIRGIYRDQKLIKSIDRLR
ncbi:DUF4293 domain-containing protein [Agriterribacter sp.]|uniref:DUF4293 domain-containing protein n=1 Tax=Agriterribacter sp. TaxID=2821509 RepID=UPI002CDB0060|nr:DUF4293 domain-containing protein [Agriterribacter sp.]HTN07515.1 DUF4293 domain-containing protein [Agriterribacter sp.]